MTDAQRETLRASIRFMLQKAEREQTARAYARRLALKPGPQSEAHVEAMRALGCAGQNTNAAIDQVLDAVAAILTPSAAPAAAEPR